MTKKITLLLAGIILLASCSTRFELVKRKYNKGFYFAVNKKSNGHKKEENHAVASKNLIVEEKVVTEVVKAAEVKATETKIAEAPVYPLTTSKVSRYVKNTKKENSRLTASASGKAPVAESRSIKALPLLKSLKSAARSASKTGNTDTNTILLVILCLFPILALVAIYLKEGKKITLNFWIDLLLHFIFLYWLFAILVVLDVINLA